MVGFKAPSSDREPQQKQQTNASASTYASNNSQLTNLVQAALHVWAKRWQINFGIVLQSQPEGGTRDRFCIETDLAEDI